VPRKKKVLPEGMVDFHRDPEKRKRTERYDDGRKMLTNLLYMIKLPKVLKYIIPFYWAPGKSIIDVTAGERISWRFFPYNHISPCGFEHWHVDFNDISPDAKADYHYRAEEINKTGKKYDILFNDFPFTELKNGVESFGTRNKKGQTENNRDQKFRRAYYFREFTPLDELFPKCVKAWNETADNLIIKIGDSHKGKRLRANHVEAIKALDHDQNNESKFNLIDCIHYRGIYSSRGGRFPFAQSVTSYYLIFKKDVDYR